LRYDDHQAKIFQEGLQQRKAAALCSLYEGGDYLHLNVSKVGQGHYSHTGQEQRHNTSIHENLARASDARAKRRQNITATQEALCEDIKTRAAAQELYAQERKRLEFQLAKAQYQKVVLPFCVWQSGAKPCQWDERQRNSKSASTPRTTSAPPFS